jgi:Immunity protein 52
MSTRFFLGAYWPARKESIEQCADRMLRFFADLRACDDALATWYELGRTRKQAQGKVADVSSRDYWLTRLKEGKNRRDTDRTVIEELGFSVGLWNGREKQKVAGLHVICGNYSAWTGGNNVTLDFPEELGTLKQPERMSGVLAAVARAWEPDWAGVMSRDAMSARAFNAKVPFVDWMVFVPRKIGNVPVPSSLTQLENGSLIMVQPDPPMETDMEALSSVHKIEAVLQQ